MPRPYDPHKHILINTAPGAMGVTNGNMIQCVAILRLTDFAIAAGES